MVLIFGVGLGILSQTEMDRKWIALLGFFGGLIYYGVGRHIIENTK